MLQIRLSKASTSDGSAGVKLSPVQTVTVACPDHLVLADLPVAKGIGAATAASNVKTAGRRSRRQLGERVHFCVHCDFPIAIYGRLSPCEHAFCLNCARSDSVCYLCGERIQKIQTIKMMEGILICAAPHCLKSFLKKTEFESHIQDSHVDILRANADKEDRNESEAQDRNESEAQSVRQSAASDSTATRGPQWPGFSSGSNSQLHDQEDKTHQQPPTEQPPSRPPLQPKHPEQGFHPQSLDMQHPPQEPSQIAERQQAVGPETPFPEHPPMHSTLPPTSNPMLNPPMPFGYPPYLLERAQPFYAAPYDIHRQDSASELGVDQSSLQDFPRHANLPGNYPQPWHPEIAGVPFEQAQGGMHVDPRDAKGILVAPLPMPLLPLLPHPPHMSRLKQNYYSGDLGHDGQGYGRQQDNRDRFGGQG